MLPLQSVAGHSGQVMAHQCVEMVRDQLERSLVVPLPFLGTLGHPQSPNC